MDVKLTQALRNYSATKTDIRPDPTTEQNFLERSVTDFAETLSQTEDIAQKAMVGTADPHALVEALANTQLAVETAVTVRDKVVEAYQEILRMPV